MFNFRIDFTDGLNGTEKLGDAPIEGVPLNSGLDIIINCLKGNFAKSVLICQASETTLLSDPLSGPADLQDYLEQEANQEKKKKFFRPCAQEKKWFKEGVPAGEQKEIDDAQFHILCNAIKESSNLNKLKLLLEIPLTEYQEQELIDAVSNNASIKRVLIVGFFSATALNNLKAIIKERPELKIDSEFNPLINNIRHESESELKEAPALFNMHVVQGFIAVLGIAAVATAFALLHAAALNPIGLTLAVGGGAALVVSAYSFFASNSSKSSEKITPDSPSPSR